MKNVHILPTEHTSRLYYNRNDKYWQLCEFPKYHTDIKSTHNIYITSDEEINFDEYYLGVDNNIYCLVSTVNSNGKKVILTTDRGLIKDGVQAIDDEFLKWFVKNPSCEEVKILRCPIEGTYILDIPEEIQPQQIWNEEKMEGVNKLIQKQKLIDMMEQDEQLGLYEETKCYCGHTTTCDCGPENPKEETLEETAERFVNSTRLKNPKSIFCEGAKWQQNNTSKVNRVEVIQHSEPYNGRAYTNYNAKEVEIQFQDRGKTLKIFLK